MKKYWLILLLVFSPSLLFAWGVMGVSGGVVANGVSCSGDFGSGDNEACESTTEGDMCTTGWGTVVDSNNILTTNSTNQYQSGAKSLEIAMTANSQVAHNTANTGALDDDFSVRFYLYTPADLSSWSGLEGSIVGSYAAGADSGDQAVIGMSSSGVRMHSGSTSDYISLSNATWYRVEYDYNGSATSTLYIYTPSGITPIDSATFTGNTSAQYHTFGQIRSTTGYYSTYYFDNIKYQSTGGYIGPE